MVLGHTLASVNSEPGYQVSLKVDVEGNGQDLNIKFPLPMQTLRQSIRHEKDISGSFEFKMRGPRLAQWSAHSFKSKETLYYHFFAQTKEQKYEIEPGTIRAPDDYSSFTEFLKPTERIQSEDMEIESLAWRLVPPDASWEDGIRNTFKFVSEEIEYSPIRGPTDAITALQTANASCNGKNRLLISLLRARGIPARMCKGLILENTSKRTTHAWTEAFVAGQWVPFCPTNNYFARIPESYLELAKADQALFTHSKHIGFDWNWIVEMQVEQVSEAVQANAYNPLNSMFHWVSLENFNISLNLIMVILMIPIAATAVSFSRNIIGFITFGTFMPALISVSFLETGFILGSLFFFSVILSATAVNFALLKLKLLHIPRLVIILTVVVTAIMIISVVTVRLGITEGAAISLFPIAILSLTSERFTQTINEDGLAEGLKRTLVTFIVAAICYALISQRFLQLLVVAYPELLLFNIAINLLIGSWHGLRLTEYYRFQSILRS